MQNAYKQALIKKIVNSENWPYLKRKSFLEELDRVAENAYNKDTVEGYLAAVLIYHQLSEELVKLLIEFSEFFIQVAIFPTEIKFSHKKIRMFGQLLEELDDTISFKNKKEFIDQCNKLNVIRINIVHKLTLKTSLANINIQAKDIKVIYDKLYSLFEEIYDDFLVRINDYSEHTDWKELANNE